MRRRPPTFSAVPTPVILGAKDLRRLHDNELVRLGDFVAEEGPGFALWTGPTGFRAGTFVKPTYRRRGSPPTEVRTSLENI